MDSSSWVFIVDGRAASSGRSGTGKRRDPVRVGTGQASMGRPQGVARKGWHNREPQGLVGITESPKDWLA